MSSSNAGCVWDAGFSDENRSIKAGSGRGLRFSFQLDQILNHERTTVLLQQSAQGPLPKRVEVLRDYLIEKLAERGN